MIELVRSNDVVLLSWLSACLRAADIHFVVFDTHTSILEGSIGAIPQRVMVLDEDETEAREIMAQAYSAQPCEAESVDMNDTIIPDPATG